MPQYPLVIFTPSGKSGRLKLGMPILTVAQNLGVNLDLVYGGREKCSRCQVDPCFYDFSKHGIMLEDIVVSDFESVQKCYKGISGMMDGRCLGCQNLIQGDLIVDVLPESQNYRQVVRRNAVAREFQIDPVVGLLYVEVAQPGMHDPTGDEERLGTALKEQWDIDAADVFPSLEARYVLQRSNFNNINELSEYIN